MARPPKIGKCVHCLQEDVKRNWDHVFPESWYPDTTPSNLAKWQIPSCVPCNKELGLIENDFLVRVALCLDPNDPASRSIVQKALRAMNPEYAKDDSDRRARLALDRRIKSEIKRNLQVPIDGVYPTLDEKWGRQPEEIKALLIPEESFRRITEKIVRGITYIETNRHIDPPYQVYFFALDDEGAKPIRDAVKSSGTTVAREPGVIVRRVAVGMTALFEIEFWKQFKTHAVVDEYDPNDHSLELTESESAS